jgi:hypothetical protein
MLTSIIPVTVRSSRGAEGAFHLVDVSSSTALIGAYESAMQW